MKIDLHLHTTASDGILEPEELAECAIRSGFKVISITDHDTVSGIRKLSESFDFSNIDVVPGIEFSTEVDNKEVHILGYYIDIKNKFLNDKLKILQEDRKWRIREIIKKINKLGIDIKYDEVVKIAQGESVGRLHIARVIVGKGYIENIQEVFNKYLKYGCEAYVPRPVFLPGEAIEIIRRCGGIPVLAHPGDNTSEREIDALIGQGLMGIEVFYPLHLPILIDYYIKMAKRKNLLITGGSDFHGFFSGNGKELSSTNYPKEYFYSLKAAFLKENCNNI